MTTTSEADPLCSSRVLPVLTQSGHRPHGISLFPNCERDLRERQKRSPHADAPFGTRGALIDCFFRCQCGGTTIMTWKLALLVLASTAMLASTPASARFYGHSHYHHFRHSHHAFFYGGQRYYSNPSAPGGGILSPSAAWNH